MVEIINGLTQLVSSPTFVGLVALLLLGLIISQWIAGKTIDRHPQLKTLTLFSWSRKLGFSALRIESDEKKIHNIMSQKYVTDVQLLVDETNDQLYLCVSYSDGTTARKSPVTLTGATNTLTATDCAGRTFSVTV